MNSGEPKPKRGLATRLLSLALVAAGTALLLFGVAAQFIAELQFADELGPYTYRLNQPVLITGGALFVAIGLIHRIIAVFQRFARFTVALKPGMLCILAGGLATICGVFLVPALESAGLRQANWVAQKVVLGIGIGLLFVGIGRAKRWW